MPLVSSPIGLPIGSSFQMPQITIEKPEGTGYRGAILAQSPQANWYRT